jgi:BolA family transcriptional regulator, general stress-responsive regulator
MTTNNTPTASKASLLSTGPANLFGTGPASADTVAQHLRAALHTTQVQVWDESASHAGHAGNPDGAGVATHLRVRIGSPLFTGQTRVAQHRLVYDACQAFLAQGLHALAIEVEPIRADAH